jgi:hypothetical protein
VVAANVILELESFWIFFWKIAIIVVFDAVEWLTVVSGQKCDC